MRYRIRPAATAIFAALTLAACSERGPVAPTALPATRLDVAAAALPAVRVSEFHYDNTGTDAGEAIEISAPAGTDLTGWQLVLYNGNTASRAPYSTTTLAGTVPATCGTRGVVVTTYASNGIQNGGSTTTGVTDPDGIALVDPAGTVIEFLSYEGAFVGASGPASGLTSTDVGVREVGTEPASPVTSLSRNGAGVWSGPATNTFGSCNDNDGPPPAEVASVTVTPASATVVQTATQAFTATAFDASSQPVGGVVFTWSSSDPAVATVTSNGIATGVAPGDVQITATAPNGIAGSAALHVDATQPPPSLPNTRFSEIHYDNTGTDAGEAIEIEGPAGTDLTGWSVVLYDGTPRTAYDTRVLSGTIPASCDGRGVIALTYATNGIQNGSPDGFALVNAAGQVVEFLSYEGTLTAVDGPAAGTLSVDIGVAEPSTLPLGQSLQRDAAGVWHDAATASFGTCNGSPPPPPASTITFTGRLPTDPALPVGFEDQLFATLHDGTGATVPSTFVWAAETPAIATIDANGVMHALTAGNATFRATAADGTTATYTLPTIVATASTTAQYGDNTEFGQPTDGDPSDDFIVSRVEYTTSFNKNRGTPNWVSYDLEATHIGSAVDRCDCFTFDPMLPGDFSRYTTADYTGAGAAAGYGIDRGHLARSFDRTAGALDNATTYYFSNIVPQASDLNQGPWALMENFLGDLARNQNKEVYIIAGVAGNKGTVKNEGKIVIPASTWKVAVIMPRDQGVANVDDLSDLEVVAVIMPNDPGVRNVPWETYKTTVDAVEALSGYDLLASLRDDIEIAVESGTTAPVAATNGPFASVEGSSIAMSAAGSSDADGDALTYAWSFGDGASGSGVTVAHTYAQDGVYTIRLIAVDIRGLADTITTSATIANVAPTVGTFAGATLFPGETYTAAGSFTDPGADAWSASVNYGDGSGTNTLSLAGTTFSLSHTYGAAGTFSVIVRVSDDDVTSSRTQTVTVLTPAQGVQNAIALVDQLAAAQKLNGGNANALRSELDGAKKQLERGNTGAAGDKLDEVLSILDSLVSSGKLSAADAKPLHDLVERVLRSITV
jgi:DNA/RNA endonuclease G (NUC1)